MQPSEETIREFKAKYGEVLVFEMDEFDCAAVLLPFTPGTCQRFVDEGIVSIDDASDRVLIRHVLWPAPAEVQAVKRQCPKLGKRIGDVLCEDAGYPITSPAKTTSDRLTDATPPGVLAQAGLDVAKAAELLAANQGARLQILVVNDLTGEVIFACVLTSPTEVELGLLRDARDKKKGYAQACLSAARACIVWSRDPLDRTFERYPAIPSLVLSAEIHELGGGDSAKRFRRR